MCLCHLDSTTNNSLSTSSTSAGAATAATSSSTAGGVTGKLSASGFLCPQCQAKYCELPVECRSCGLTLVSAPHLARSYHHLFPLPPFEEVSRYDGRTFVAQLPSILASFLKILFSVQTPLSTLSEDPPPRCFACSKRFSAHHDASVFRCPDCRRFCCCDCDVFVHETLHSCPGRVMRWRRSRWCRPPS